MEDMASAVTAVVTNAGDTRQTVAGHEETFADRRRSSHKRTLKASLWVLPPANDPVEAQSVEKINFIADALRKRMSIARPIL